MLPDDRNDISLDRQLGGILWFTIGRLGQNNRRLEASSAIH